MAVTAKGHIEQLPSGSYRVKVYAGTDPVTGKERRLRETCPDETSAAIALGRLLKEAEGHVAPERDALFGRVLDVYLEVTELAATTRVTHESYIRRVIRPVLGDVKARNQRAAAVIPAQLDELRKKERGRRGPAGARWQCPRWGSPLPRSRSAESSWERTRRLCSRGLAICGDWTVLSDLARLADSRSGRTFLVKARKCLLP